MKESLVLLPGMMCDARLFAPQIVAFGGDHNIHLAPISTADAIEKIAEQVLARAPSRFALIGHGMGGVVGFEMVRRAPARVSRIAVMASTAMAEPPGLAAAREEKIVRAKSGKLDQVMREDFGEGDLAPGPNRDEIYQMVMRMALDLGPDVYVRQSRAMQRRQDQQKTLRKLKILMLIMCGEHDQLTPPRRHEFMADLALGSRLEIIAGAGHLPSLEQPETVNSKLREWLHQPLVLRQPVLPKTSLAVPEFISIKSRKNGRGLLAQPAPEVPR